jgi:osmotically inducible lipoprotein OsmB
MRNSILAVCIGAAVVVAAPAARADWVGAAAGAGTGLVVAGPVGAVAGGVIGGVFGRPFWGPPISRGACWTDDYFRRHCRTHARM